MLRRVFFVLLALPLRQALPFDIRYRYSFEVESFFFSFNFWVCTLFVTYMHDGWKYRQESHLFFSPVGCAAVDLSSGKNDANLHIGGDTRPNEPPPLGYTVIPSLITNASIRKCNDKTLNTFVFGCSLWGASRRTR